MQAGTLDILRNLYQLFFCRFLHSYIKERGNCFSGKGWYIKKEEIAMNKKAWKRKVLSLVVVFAMLLTNVSAAFASEQNGLAYPTFEEAYQSMADMKAKYPEGTPWTNDTPYGKDGPAGSYYEFQGGKVNGGSLGVGCAAFAFLLSDAAFGNLPAYTYNNGDFKFEDVKVGDILRINNSHFVVVLKKSAGGVIVAEGNYNKSVHWGRAMSESDVENANFIVSRYPKNYEENNQDADKVQKEGTEGNLNWTLTNSGTLTVTVTGGSITADTAIPDYDNSTGDPSWKAYSETINTIVIGQGITAIGNSAFRGLGGVLRVFIPDTVKTIGNDVFREDTNLLSVTIPGSVETIGNDAFYGCTSLSSATVSEGVKTIGERAFHSCTSLQYIDFPKSIQSIGAGAFVGCEKMLQVRFMPGTGDVTIGDNPFTQCWNLVYVALPDGLDKLSPGMFESCKSIQELYIPASVKSLGEVGTTSPFMSAEIANIFFGGTETAWNEMVSLNPQLKATISDKTIIHYNHPFEDPSVTDGNDGLIKDEEGEDPKVTPTPAGPGNTGSSGGSVRPVIPMPSPSPAATVTPSPTAAVTPSPTATAAPATPSPTAMVTAVPDTPKPTVTPGLPLPPANSDDTVDPTAKPTVKPTSTPKPTAKPTSTPSLATVKKQLNSSIKSQLKTKLKTKLTNKLQKKYGKKTKAQLKKSLKTELKAKLKPVIKANMKKKYGKQLGTKFTAQFNAKYNAQYNALYSKQFEQVYKKVSKSKKKK